MTDTEPTVPLQTLIGALQENAELKAAITALTDRFSDESANSIARGVQAELERREIRRQADAEEAMKAHRPAVHRSLADALANPMEEEPFSIEGLLPYGGNVVFSARHKSGKSTLIGQLARAYVDSKPFLDEFAATPLESGRENVCIFNYEMSQAQFEDWLRKMDIENTDRIHIFHLRGNPHPLKVSGIRDEIVTYLTETQCGLWVVDTAARALAPGSVSKDEDVNPFLGHLEEIKERAGVRDMVVSHHMPHSAATGQGGELRAMGCTAWSAWPDALWILSKDEEKRRFFAADGRSVDLAEGEIIFDQERWLNSYIGVSKDQAVQQDMRARVREALEESPELNKRELREAIPGDNNAIDRAVADMIESGEVELYTNAGPTGRAHAYRITRPVTDVELPVWPEDQE